MLKKTLLIIINSLLVMSFFSYGMGKRPNENLQKNESKASYILYSNNNAYGLMKEGGKPFFSLGINHIQAITYPTPLEIFYKKYDGKWTDAALDIKKNLLKWDFNTAGYGTPNELRKIMPFMMPCQPLVQNSAYLGKDQFSYADIFDPKIKKEIVKKIENMTREKDNPNLVGYYWTDTPMWDLEKSRKRFGMNWVDFIKNLPEESYGKKRYNQFKRDCLLSQYPAKDDDFLGIIAEEYYGLIGPATRKNDPNTLIFGERYLMDNHPKQVLIAALPFIDVLSIQPNGTCFINKYYDDLYAFIGKPIIICDHQCSFPTHSHKHTMWEQLESQEHVCGAYDEHLIAAASKPYIIGYHRCQYMDRYDENLEMLKQGMVQQNGVPYEPHATLIKEVNKKAKDLFNKNRFIR